MELGINAFNVIQSDGFVQQHFVEGSGKTTVDIMTMEHCDANYTPHKVKVGQVLLSQHTYTLVTVFYCNNSFLSDRMYKVAHKWPIHL